MKIKTQKYSGSKYTFDNPPHLACTAKKGKYSLGATVLPDGYGHYFLNKDNQTVASEDSGSIKEWLQHAKDMKKAYSALEAFLASLQETYKKNKKELGAKTY